tara:strand:+ start:5335 stop:5664 length:330 start_codon:yes stop_codon:yes gene_type:complete
MKMFLISVIAVMAMVLCGWLTFATSDEVVSVSLDTAEVKEDTSKAVEAGEKLLDKVSEVAGDAVESAEKAVDKAIDDTAEDSAEPDSAEAGIENASAKPVESTEQSETE